MKRASKRALYGAAIQYSDGRIVQPARLNVDRILSDFEQSDSDARGSLLCVFAHSLTVEIRALLFDRPVSETDFDRVYQINESLHQLTSCVNPKHRRSASGDAELVRAIIDSSHLYGLEAVVGRALATAASSANTAKRGSPLEARRVPAMSDDDLPPYSDVERELLLFLYRSGGDRFSRRADEVYSPLADTFGLTREQRNRLRADREESAWNKRVQWARRKLVEAGLMFSGPRGVWRLTESGRHNAEEITRERH